MVKYCYLAKTTCKCSEHKSEMKRSAMSSDCTMGFLLVWNLEVDEKWSVLV